MRFLVFTLALACAPWFAIAQSDTDQDVTEEDSETELPLRPIALATNLEIELGQRAVVHGLRGDCGALPQVAELSETQTTRLGYLILGRPGLVPAEECGGATPAYEIIYVPQRTGREKLTISGSTIRMRVRRSRDDD